MSRNKEICTQEHSQEWNPHKVFKHGIDESPLTQSIFQQGKRDVARAWKHDGACKPYLEAVHIPPVNLHSESQQQIVEQR
jgi:hypothetical protein